MAKTLHADGANGGHAYIFEGSASEIGDYENPTAADIGNLYFHSNLSYLAESQILEATITHPQRTQNSSSSKWSGTNYTVTNGSQEFSIGSHTKGLDVPAIGFLNGNQMSAGHVIQNSAGSLRSVSLFITSNEVRVFEEFVTFQYTLPAIDVTYKVLLFDYLSSGSGNIAINMNPTSFSAGFGKLNTDYKYTRRQNTNPDFYLSKDKTADVANGGLKLVPPNGISIYESSNYNGSFTGSTGTGVDI